MLVSGRRLHRPAAAAAAAQMEEMGKGERLPVFTDSQAGGAVAMVLPRSGESRLETTQLFFTAECLRKSLICHHHDDGDEDDDDDGGDDDDDDGYDASTRSLRL